MTGSENFVDGHYGKVTTLDVYIRITIGEINISSIYFSDITGRFSYYNVERKNTITGEIVNTEYVTSSTYLDINLNPGATYKYSFTPFLIYENAVLPPYQGLVELKTITTYNCNILTASIGEITPTSVTINDISGNFTYFSVIRDGITSKVYLNLLPTATFIDQDPRIVPGATYTYTMIPSIQTVGGQILDGQKSVIGTATIPLY